MPRGNGNEQDPDGVRDHGTGSNGSQARHESDFALNEAEAGTELQAALRSLEATVRENPENAANWFHYGMLLRDAGEFRRAEAMLRQAVRRSPESANYRFYLGTALGDNQKFAEAARQFKSIAEVDPQLINPMSMIGLSSITNLGYCLGEMGRWKEAVAALTPAMSIAISILDDLAGFISMSGNYNQACFLYSVALALAPRTGSLLHGAGHSHMKAGRLPEALAHLRRARRASPEDPDVSYDLGLTLARMKKRKEARRCFRRVLELDPKYFWAWYDLACLDALERRPAAAFRNLYKSIECGFNDGEYLLRDTDFKSIRKDPRWSVVLDCLSKRAKKD